MRGDQLARQWRIIRANEASPNWLTVKETAKREEAGIRTIYHDLEALQAAGFPLYTVKVQGASRLAFIDTFKLKITSFLLRNTARSAKRKCPEFSNLKIYLFQFLGQTSCACKGRQGNSDQKSGGPVDQGGFREGRHYRERHLLRACKETSHKGLK
jgi:hypothetical protein